MIRTEELLGKPAPKREGRKVLRWTDSMPAREEREKAARKLANAVQIGRISGKLVKARKWREEAAKRLAEADQRIAEIMAEFKRLQA